jgi:hypothetical protein
MPNWRSSQSPEAWWSNDTLISMSGIENLSIDHSGSGTTVTSGVCFYNAYNCCIRNVRSLNSNRNHVWFYQSAHITARDSYFYGTANAASQSYGVEQFMGADNLVENNIFQHVTAPMMNAGGTGSVFGYNYAVDDYYFASAWQQSSSYHHADAPGQLRYGARGHAVECGRGAVKPDRVQQRRARHSGASEFPVFVGETLVVDRDPVACDRTRHQRWRGSDGTRVQNSGSRLLRHHGEDRRHPELQRGQLLSSGNRSRGSDEPQDCPPVASVFIITIAVDGHAVLNSIDSRMLDGTSSRRIR